MLPDLSITMTKISSMMTDFLKILPNILVALVVLLIFWFVASLVKQLVIKLAVKSRQAREVGLVLGRIARWSVIIIGLLIAITIIFPSLNAGSLFGALGVGGIAIGFAFKDIFQNLLAGLLILITRPFHIGDQIKSQDHEGTVEDIEIRATTIRTYDNRLVVIPNSELYTNRIVVNTFYRHRRISVGVGIGYDDDIPLAKKVILEQLKNIEGVLDIPEPKVLVKEMGDSSVNLDIRFWISPPNRKEEVELSDEVLTLVKPALFDAGISIPFPMRQLVWDPTSTTVNFKEDDVSKETYNADRDNSQQS